MNVRRREKDETRVFKKMGEAIGWGRDEGVAYSKHNDDRIDSGKGGVDYLQAFTPGQGMNDGNVILKKGKN
jgi:hypothetical protein